MRRARIGSPFFGGDAHRRPRHGAGRAGPPRPGVEGPGNRPGRGVTRLLIVAAAAGERAARSLGPLVLVVLVVAAIVSLFYRRIGGKVMGSEKASVPAFWLRGAIVVGIIIATR